MVTGEGTMRVSDGVLDVVGVVADLRLGTRVYNQGIIRSIWRGSQSSNLVNFATFV